MTTILILISLVLLLLVRVPVAFSLAGLGLILLVAQVADVTQLTDISRGLGGGYCRKPDTGNHDERDK